MTDRPNVLVICTDHWAGRLFGREHPCFMSPTVNQLAANGVRFTNAYTATPSCIPARRALMTGTTARTHGDRIFNETLRMPALPTLPQVFAEAGYQSYAVGKLHVYPQRDRIGFDEVILNEEGRHHLGLRADDYELFLAEQGHPGAELAHGMCTNDYMTRPWHLPEKLHPTTWTAYEACRMINRRDPTRPAFWYVSFNHPHPPLAPLAEYMDLYRDAGIPVPFLGDWARDRDAVPYALKARRYYWDQFTELEIRNARRAYYALCTHIDHYIRLIIGLLREQGLLDNTIIAFTADHGDMLGNHNLWAKTLMYEESARIPFIVVPTADYAHLGHHRVDDRLVELRDLMPTLLDMAGIAIPETVEGMSLLSGERRECLYGEHFEDDRATRMIVRQGADPAARHKLIYYPVGNRFQLFDLQHDPDEVHDLSGDPASADLLADMTRRLMDHLYGEDLQWISEGRLVGLPDKEYVPAPNRGLSGQRGWRFMG